MKRRKFLIIKVFSRELLNKFASVETMTLQRSRWLVTEEITLNKVVQC